MGLVLLTSKIFLRININQEIVLHRPPKNIAFVSVALNTFTLVLYLSYGYYIHEYILITYSPVDHNNTMKRKCNLDFFVASKTEGYN